MSHELSAGGDAVFGYVKIIDSDGAPVTSLTHASAGLSLSYYRDGAAAAVPITLATMTLGTWASGGFVHVGGGIYQIGLPAAAVAELASDSKLVFIFGTYTDGQVVPMALSPLAAPVDGAATQATLLLVKAKTNAIKSGVNVQFPYVSANGLITIYEGFDSTDVGNASIEIAEESAGQFDATRVALGSFGFYMRSQETDADYNGPATISTDGELYTLKAQILSIDLPDQRGLYDWYFYAIAPGTGSDEQGEFAIVVGELDLKRGKRR